MGNYTYGNNLGLTGNLGTYYNAVRQSVDPTPYTTIGQGDSMNATTVMPNYTSIAAGLKGHNIDTTGMSDEQIGQRATDFLNDVNWWHSPEATRMAEEGVKRGNIDQNAGMNALAPLIFAGGIGALGMLGGAGAAGANSGYIDVLGGMTDATGTALPGWGEMAATMPVSPHPDIGAVSPGPIPSSEYVSTLGDWPTAAEVTTPHGSMWDTLNPPYNPNVTHAPWANADPTLRVGSPEWAASAGQGTTMANGQTLNLPEWIAANPQAAAAVGATSPGFFEQLMNTFKGSSGSNPFNLGDTASGALGLLSKLLTAYGAAKANRESLSENDRRLREAKDTTPLSSTQFSMLRPTALRRAKGGLAQCAECGGAGGPSMARYVRGGTAGQSDKIPAMLSDGEYVFDADTVAALGDGNNEAGASALEQMRQNIRKHKRSAPPTKIPPKAKKPEQYLKGAK